MSGALGQRVLLPCSGRFVPASGWIPSLPLVPPLLSSPLRFPLQFESVGKEACGKGCMAVAGRGRIKGHQSYRATSQWPNRKRTLVSLPLSSLCFTAAEKMDDAASMKMLCKLQSVSMYYTCECVYACIISKRLA